jgi:phospholipase C
MSLLLATVLPGGLTPFPSWAKAGGPGSIYGDTSTPIKHLVVIFQENVSFDHYFGTYPNAANPIGEPRFRPLPSTPPVNGFTPGLLYNNPNALNAENGKGAVNPFRLSRSQAATADQDHDYTPEQMSFNKGLMDLFPKSVGTPGPAPSAPPAAVNTNGLTMGYYDGNTVTALWNYAQHFAMSDNSYNTNFGPSTPGALNLISGQTNGVIATRNGTADNIDGGNGSSTVIGDPDPVGDVCSGASTAQVQMGGVNIGNLLSNAGVTWGWFNGGFDLSVTNPNGSNGCGRSTTSLVTNQKKPDYSPHHQPFQYYTSTANPTHARPGSIGAIGHDGDAANHQYDLNDFYAAVKAGNFPAVSFLKGPAYQDGHAGYSDPLDEQEFMVHVINFLQTTPEWKNTAVVIAYDDSDGWYDHQMPPIVNQSTTSADALTAVGACGDGNTALPGIDSGNLHAQGRCGYGPRLPLLVISPFAKHNYVDHTVTDQTSILRFIEDNWLDGQRIGQGSFDSIANSMEGMFDFKQEQKNRFLFLDEKTGLVQNSSSHSD